MEAQLRSIAQLAGSSSQEQFRARSSATPVPVLVSRLCDGLILYANAQLASLVPTAEVTRGEIVSDLQQRLQVPVGDRLLGRMLNLFGFFGEAIDRKEPIAGGEWRSIHADRDVRGRYPSLNPQNSEAIDLLTPLERGRKTGLLGGAGVGKTVLITENDWIRWSSSTKA